MFNKEMVMTSPIISAFYVNYKCTFFLTKHVGDDILKPDTLNKIRL